MLVVRVAGATAIPNTLRNNSKIEGNDSLVDLLEVVLRALAFHVSAVANLEGALPDAICRAKEVKITYIRLRSAMLAFRIVFAERGRICDDPGSPSHLLGRQAGSTSEKR